MPLNRRSRARQTPATLVSDADGATTYAPPESLAGTAAWGLKWRLGSQVVREGTRLVVAVLLARILTPGEWGLAAMALVFAAFLELVPDTMTVGLVQRARITEVDRSTVFWTATTLGLGLAATGIACSGLVADFFGEPDVRPLFAAVCVGFAITTLRAVPETLLARALAYRSLELRQMAAAIVGGVTAVVFALAGAGAWAIVANSIAGTTTSCILLWWFARWHPRLTFSTESLRSLGSEGVRVLGTGVLTNIQMNADRVLMGRYLGAGPVGSYALAYQVMFTPIGNIAYPLQAVLFPVFATMQQETERLTAAWLRTKRLSVALMAPAFLTLFVVAQDFIPVVFGSRWAESARILQLLCIAGVGYSLATQNWSLLVVRGRTGVLLALTFLNTAVIVTAVLVGLEWGAVGVAASFAVARWALVFPEMWITTHAGRVAFGETFRATFTPLLFAAAAAAGALALRIGMVEVGVPAEARLVLVAGALLIAYAALSYVGSAMLRADARIAVERLRARRASGAAAR